VGNLHDSRVLDQLINQVKDKIGKPASVTVDAEYKTPPIEKFLMNQEIRPFYAIHSPRTKEVYLKKYEYVYDEHFDFYICPEGQVLPYRTKTRDEYI
jgi:hypothetical protein